MVITKTVVIYECNVCGEEYQPYDGNKLIFGYDTRGRINNYRPLVSTPTIEEAMRHICLPCINAIKDFRISRIKTT